MKKIIAVLASFVLSMSVISAQVLKSSGINHTLWTGFGAPLDSVRNDDRAYFHYYGLIETLQARIDIGKFTVEGMLNWGALTNWDGRNFTSLTFANTRLNPFWYTNHNDQGGWWTNGEIDGYYVNFLFHPFEGFDVGMGTRLEWKIGPAPSSLGNFWQPYAHVIQGGLKDAVPGGADVAGYAYYANTYTGWYNGNTKASLGLRYRYKDFLEAGITIPSGVTTTAPLFNFAFMIHPIEAFSASVAYEGVLQGNGNFYTGLSLYLSNFTLDAYLGINGIGGADNDSRFGTGAAITWSFPKVGITIRPEVGFTFWENVDYTASFYFGGRLDFEITKQIILGAWSSCAWGSYNRQWDKLNNDWFGGFIFDIRPDITFAFNNHHSLSIFFDYQNRTRFDNVVRDTWAAGFYWTYK